jgi:hypothetical protein
MRCACRWIRASRARGIGTLPRKRTPSMLRGAVSLAFGGHARVEVYSKAKANAGSFAGAPVCSPRHGETVGRCDERLKGRCRPRRKEEQVREAILLDMKI